MRRFAPPAAALAVALAVAACGPREARADRAWVRLPAVAGQPAAAYFELHGGRDNDRLIAVASALATRAEMHESMGAMDMMSTMRPLDAVAVPAHLATPFRPGGRHVMLIGLDRSVTPGTAVPLRFGFASGATAEAEAKTVAAGEPAPY